MSNLIVCEALGPINMNLIKLPRKPTKLQVKATRTANRHR
jgi:hypothetical protein